MTLRTFLVSCVCGRFVCLFVLFRVVFSVCDASDLLLPGAEFLGGSPFLRAVSAPFSNEILLWSCENVPSETCTLRC